MKIELTKGYQAIVSDCDYERELTVELPQGLVWTGRICDKPWHASVKPNTTYAVCRYKGVEVRLHRLVMQAKRGQIIDHINGNGCDNRRKNLRLVTAAENARNRGKTIGDKKYKGVSFHKATGKWSAQIKVNNKKIHLGLFASDQLAALAYDEAAREHFGKYATTNMDCQQLTVF